MRRMGWDRLVTTSETTVPSSEYHPAMLPETVHEAARRFTDRTAYIAPQRAGADWNTAVRVTYADLDLISDEVAHGMIECGVQEGDRVALLLPPGLDYLVAYISAAKIGAITAGVNHRLAAQEQRTVIAAAAPQLVLVRASGDDSAGGEQTISTGASVVAVPIPDSIANILQPLRQHGAGRFAAVPTRPDRDVAIIFTSGTTGQPKGALYSNAQLAFITATDMGDSWDTGGTTLTGTSFAHLGFMTKLPGNLRKGGVTYILEQWRARAALELICDYKMTVVAGVPAQLALMLREPDFDSFDLSSLQYIVAGGGPITAGLAEEARTRFGAKLQTRYSCTEAGIGLGTAFDDPLEDAVLSVGRPHPSVEVAIRRSAAVQSGPDAVIDAEADTAADVPIGEVGEVCLRSPACMRGYINDPVATAAAFTPDGFVRTGDLGYIDDHGRVRLAGRTKEMYVRGGYNVYPVEVESVLSEHPGVANVAIVPRPDRVMGEIGVAVVVVRSGTPAPNLDELRAFAAHSLASFKLPEAIAFRNALPLTAMDKLDRNALTADVIAHEPPR